MKSRESSHYLACAGRIPYGTEAKGGIGMLRLRNCFASRSSSFAQDDRISLFTDDWPLTTGT
jgi:hypothetical protein